MPASTRRLNHRKEANKPKEKAKPKRPMDKAPVVGRSRRILAAMVAFRDGNFSARLPSDWEGIDWANRRGLQPSRFARGPTFARNGAVEPDCWPGRIASATHVGSRREGWVGRQS